MFRIKDVWKKELPKYLEQFLDGQMLLISRRYGLKHHYTSWSGYEWNDKLKVNVIQCLLKWQEEGCESLIAMMEDVNLFLSFPLSNNSGYYSDGDWDHQAHTYLNIPYGP